MRRVLVLSCLLLVSGPAFASSLILHNSAGHDCYLETLRDPTPENTRRAIAVCNQAVDDARSDPDSYNQAAALVNRGDVRLRAQDYAGAIADSKQAIAIYRDLSQAYLNLGAGMIGLGHYDDALPSLDKAIDLNGGEPERAYFNRGLAKENIGDIRGAYYDYRKAVEINPRFEPATEQLTRFKIVVTPGA
jgi:tetratricopeptide (TPR) repeat protein